MALDYRSVVEARNQGLIDQALAAARGLVARIIRQPGGLATAVFCWDSGASGTALTASATRRSPVVRVPFPSVLRRWDIQGYPSGSATVAVYMAASGVALSAATLLVTLTLTSQEENSATGLETTVPAEARLFALLTSVTTCETLAANLELAKVPDDA